jgi:PAS domain-containing protein
VRGAEYSHAKKSRAGPLQPVDHAQPDKRALTGLAAARILLQSDDATAVMKRLALPNIHPASDHVTRTTVHSLMARTVAAERRLRAMRLKEENGNSRAQQMRTVSKEVNDALEELRLAVEQLQLAAEDISAARLEANRQSVYYRELVAALPLACVMTSQDGGITDANLCASRLLNTPLSGLRGRPLWSYFPEDDTHAHIRQQISSEGHVSTRFAVRPLEREPLHATVKVFALNEQAEWCWIISDDDLAGESDMAVKMPWPLPM